MYSRRGILRAGSAVGVTALAGCVAPRADLASRQRQAGSTAGQAPLYRRWVPAGDEPLGSAAVRYLDRSILHAGGDALPAPLAGSALEYWAIGDWFGHALEDLEGVLAFSGSPLTVAYLGSIDTGIALDTLETADYDVDSEHEDWTILVRTDQPVLVGVTDGAVVQTLLAGTETDAIEAGRDRVASILETGLGERQPRHAEDDHFDRLTTALGRGLQTTVPLGPADWLPESGGWGTAVDADGTEALRRATVVADDLSAVDHEAFSIALEDRWGLTPEVHRRKDDLTAIAELDAEPIGDVTQAIPPRVSIGSSFDADAGRLEITHLAGHALDLSRLSVVVVGSDAEPLTVGEGTLEPGGQFTLGGVPADAQLAVQYDRPAGGPVSLAGVETRERRV